jgi:hypothetical protein
MNAAAKATIASRLKRMQREVRRGEERRRSNDLKVDSGRARTI